MAPSANRKRTILALIVAGSLAAAFALPALAATSTKFYTPSFISPIPTSSSPGATVSYTFKIVNGPNSTQQFGSANITAPSGFVVGSVGTPQTFNSDGSSANKTWTSAKSGSTIMLRNPGPGPTNRLNLGQYVTVQFDAVAACVTGSSLWDSRVKQSNDFSGTGNDFTQSGPDPAVNVATGGGGVQLPASIQFSAQPSDTVVDDPITPAVQVTVMDACNVASGTGVAMSIGTNPGGAGTLSGTLSQTTNSSGVATFGDLSINHSSSGYTLRATAGSLNAISDSFDILSDTANCTGSCSVSAASGGSSVTVDSNGTGTLSVTFESVPLDCSTSPDSFQVGVTVTINPPSNATQVTTTFDDVIVPPFADHYPVCKTVEQTDGTTKTEIVKFCSDTDPVDTPPCVESQEIQFHGSAPTILETVVKMTATDPKIFH